VNIHTRPSRLYLAKLESPPATIFDYLLARFPQVHPHVWRARVARGLVTLSDGTTLRHDSPYRHGITVFYQKEVPLEPAALEEPLINYRDEEIIVVAAENADTELNFPANMQNVIAVVSSEKNSSALPSTGQNLPMGPIAAPGRERLTTVPANHYDFYSGSSMAAAYVSGVAALLKEAKPKASAAAIKKILLGQSPDPFCVLTLLQSAEKNHCRESVGHD
jgi:hypothetical protein